jgi:hypothetical protein
MQKVWIRIDNPMVKGFVTVRNAELIIIKQVIRMENNISENSLLKY